MAPLLTSVLLRSVVRGPDVDSIRLNLLQQEGFLESLFQLLPSSTGAPAAGTQPAARLAAQVLQGRGNGDDAGPDLK